MVAAASSRAPTRRSSWLRAPPLGLVGDVELRTHWHRGETDAALALEVVDDGGVTRNRLGEPPAAVVTAAGDDGVGVAGLDAVRRKMVLRRDETEPPRALPCVGRSPTAFQRSTASLSRPSSNHESERLVWRDRRRGSGRRCSFCVEPSTTSRIACIWGDRKHPSNESSAEDEE